MVWRRSCATRSSDTRITAWRRRSGRFEGKGGGRQAIKLSTPTVCAETAGRVCSWFDLPRLSWMMNAHAAAAPRWRCRELETGFCWRVFTLAAEICSYPAARFRWIIAVPSLLPRLRVQSLSPCREGFYQTTEVCGGLMPSASAGKVVPTFITGELPVL